MFQQLFLIMQAFIKAIQIVLLMVMLIVILDYVLAIILTQAVGDHAYLWGKDEYLIKTWFGSITRSMNSMFIIMTLSDWENFANVLMQVIPAPIVFLSFVFYIMVTSYTMVSLVTAIVSESLITSQQEFKRRKLQTREKKKKGVTGELLDFLLDYHEDNVDEEGAVGAEDLKQSVRGDQELLRNLPISVCRSGNRESSSLSTNSAARHKESMSIISWTSFAI